MLASLNLVIIFPFLTSQIKAPFLDVAPAMQFKSPLGYSDTYK